ncbi:unnamed protein product [Allacma fusca]|uniref:Uncharacterized protein n=1 Tax=Allacma fusca TaxID=39272 RepID=A0A8J2NRE1_9HEXA|nr:unnamed protein product [Allacma fusca]
MLSELPAVPCSQSIKNGSKGCRGADSSISNMVVGVCGIGNTTASSADRCGWLSTSNESGLNLGNRHVRFLLVQQGNQTIDMGSGHAGTGHGGVRRVGADSARNGILSWCRDGGLDDGLVAGSSAAEVGHLVLVVGSSNGDGLGGVTRATQSVARSTFITSSEYRGDTSIDPRIDDSIKETVVSDESPTVTDGNGSQVTSRIISWVSGQVRADEELTASNEISSSTASISVHSLARDEFSCGGNTDSVGASNHGSNSVSSMSVEIGGGKIIFSRVEPTMVSTVVVSQGNVGWSDTSVKTSNENSASVNSLGPGCRCVNGQDTPLFASLDGAFGNFLEGNGFDQTSLWGNDDFRNVSQKSEIFDKLEGGSLDADLVGNPQWDDSLDGRTVLVDHFQGTGLSFVSVSGESIEHGLSDSGEGSTEGSGLSYSAGSDVLDIGVLERDQDVSSSLLLESSQKRRIQSWGGESCTGKPEEYE